MIRMSKIYARIQAGVVQEIIQGPIDGEGNDIPIQECFYPDIVAMLVDITDVIPLPEERWAYDGSTFSPYVQPMPSAQSILAANTSTRDALIAEATNRIAPLQDAVDLGEATDAETALLKKWKQYRVAVNRVDLTQANPVWPITPSA